MSTTKTIPYSQPQVQKTRTVSTKLNYEPLAPGEKREVFPMTASIFRRKYDTRDVEISDVRSPENGGEFDLNRHGFKYIKDPIDGRDMTDEAKIKADYYPALVEMLKKETGATRIVPFGHVVRTDLWQTGAREGKDLPDLAAVKPRVPVHFVHIDYSYEGASTILHQSVSSEEAEQLSKTRWAAINVWRPLNHAVTREPLSVCDAESVAEEDLCGVCSTSQGRSFETWVLKYSPNHKWYYMSQQTPDDVLIIKIYDSKKDGRARRTPHSAFYAPNEYGPARNSIETRCLVFWEDQDAE